MAIFPKLYWMASHVVNLFHYQGHAVSYFKGSFLSAEKDLSHDPLVTWTAPGLTVLHANDANRFKTLAQVSGRHYGWLVINLSYYADEIQISLSL